MSDALKHILSLEKTIVQARDVTFIEEGDEQLYIEN